MCWESGRKEIALATCGRKRGRHLRKKDINFALAKIASRTSDTQEGKEVPGRENL